MILEAGKRLVVLALLLLVALASASSMLDDPATEYVDAGMKRALTTFAVARSLNAAISLAQGTEVAAGVGAELTLSVGQVLDPVNDLVESFSDLMLMASVAFGIQKILIVIVPVCEVAGYRCTRRLGRPLFARQEDAPLVGSDTGAHAADPLCRSCSQRRQRRDLQPVLKRRVSAKRELD